jgi:hypothetical protein
MGACRRRRLIRNVELPNGEVGDAKVTRMFGKVKSFDDFAKTNR